MTVNEDILGRPPVMGVIERDELDLTPDDDWRGERFMKVPRNPHAYSGRNMVTNKLNHKKAVTLARREKVAVMRGNGMTETNIAAQLGCSHTTIRNDFKALGLPE